MNGEISHCSGCNAEMDPDAIFCNECGTAELSAVGGPLSEPSRASDVADIGRHSSPLPQTERYKNTAPPPPTIAPGTNLLCPGCNKAFATDDKFCRHCAFDLSKIAAVSSARFCTGCGKSFGSGDRFCRHCAMDLSNSDHTIAFPVVTQSSVSEITKTQPPSTLSPLDNSDFQGPKTGQEIREVSDSAAVNFASDAKLPGASPSYARSARPTEQPPASDLVSEPLHRPVVSNRSQKKAGSGLGVAIGCIGIVLMITSFVALGWARNYIQKNLFTSGLGGLIGYQDSTFELAKGVQEIAPLGLIAGLVLLIVGGVLAIARRF